MRVVTIDVSARTVLAACNRCSHRDLELSRPAALRAAAAHQAQAHSDPDAAARCRELATRSETRP